MAYRQKMLFVLGDAYGLGVFSAIRMNVIRLISWKTSHELETLLKPGLILLLSMHLARFKFERVLSRKEAVTCP
jgi:hypothetical protein